MAYAKRLMTVRMRIASRFMAKAPLPSDVETPLAKLRFNDLIKNADLERGPLLAFAIIEDVEVYQVGYVLKGNTIPDVVVNVGRNIVNGEVSCTISKMSLNGIDVYKDNQLVGTLLQYVSVNTVYGGSICLILEPATT